MLIRAGTLTSHLLSMCPRRYRVHPTVRVSVEWPPMPAVRLNPRISVMWKVHRFVLRARAAASGPAWAT